MRQRTMHAVVWLHLLAILWMSGSGGTTTGQQTLKVNDLKTGERINILCHTNGGNFKFLNLQRLYSNPGPVIRINKTSYQVISPAYTNRTFIRNEFPKVTITISKLQESDTDVYMCEYLNDEDMTTPVFGTGTLLMVKGVKTPLKGNQCNNELKLDTSTLLIATSITVIFVLVIMFLGMCLWKTDLIKNMCSKKQPKETVYEEMVKRH
ncbi:uncharacterized protein LOC127530152 [Erpetoichthys calabaricus]|uniref:uncharacterized protein LOC127530152 n=1 Tax=Erpetoichthys calabaricus TaxID=27687 RepID=UPI0022342683|nr:uncharacterized protein LOC127530152 [Erpetoichthys calabaricus]